MSDAIAIQASFEAAEARRVACMSYIEGFQAQGATVEAKQQYAQCVQIVHPSSIDFPPFFGKAFVLLFLILLVVLVFKIDADDMIERCTFALVFSALIAVAAFVISALVLYLFS